MNETDDNAILLNKIFGKVINIFLSLTSSLFFCTVMSLPWLIVPINLIKRLLVPSSPIHVINMHSMENVKTLSMDLVCFTVSLRNPNGRLLGLCNGTGSCIWKALEIPISHVRQKCIATKSWFSAGEESPSLYLYQPIIQLATPANHRPCFIPHWQSFNHKAGSV